MKNQLYKPKFKTGDLICYKTAVYNTVWHGQVIDIIGAFYQLKWSDGGVDKNLILNIDAFCELRTNVEDIWQNILNEKDLVK
jgi:hypothetical protein